MFLFSPNAGKYGPEKTLYLDTFHAVKFLIKSKIWLILTSLFASSYTQRIIIKAFQESANYVAQSIVAFARNPVNGHHLNLLNFDKLSNLP